MLLKERTIRPVLRRFKDVPEAPKERTAMGQRPLKNSYLRVFQFRPLVVLPWMFKDNPEVPKERTFPPVDSRSVEFF